MTEIERVREISEKMQGSHKFLAEELMVPNLNKADGTRINMFCNHFIQSVVPIEGDYPKVFTNFENQVGKYSSSYKVADRDWKVVKKVIKNKFNYSLILLNEETNYVHIVNIKKAERITEKYGYKYVSKVAKKEEGDTINKGDLIYRSTAHDDQLNFRYGHNLKAIFMAYDGLTYEDSIVVSETAAKKLATYNVENVEITINTNDFLINRYGDDKTYKCIPNVGEEMEDSILCARRRINHDSILVDLMDTNIKKINPDNDMIFFCHKGVVIDTDVFSNMPIDQLEKFKYNHQLIKIIKNNDRYYRELAEGLKPFFEDDKYEKSDDVNFTYKRAIDYINPERKFRYDGNLYDNIVLRIKVLSENKVEIGSKISGRYGSKGCVSKILPDDQMPENEYGERAEVILNPLGVISRLNLAQLYEQELNYMGDEIVRMIKKETSNNKKFDILYDFLSRINKTYADYIKDHYPKNKKEQNEFFEEINEHGIYIHQPPFFGNITMDQMADLYKHYGFEGYTINTKINNQICERKMIMGDMYYMRLKHYASSKMSARSSSYVNINNLPSKSLSFKEHQVLFSNTPIRLGEMEFTNLFLTQDIETERKFFDQYSTSPEERQHMIEYIATHDVFNLGVIEELDASESYEKKSIVNKIFEVYFTALGLKVVFDDDGMPIIPSDSESDSE